MDVFFLYVSSSIDDKLATTYCSLIELFRVHVRPHRVRKICSIWRSTTASISRFEQTAKRKSVELRSRKHTAARENLAGINHATASCVSTIAKHDRCIFWRN